MYTAGTHTEAAKFFKMDTAHAISEQKTGTHSSLQNEAHTEPLTQPDEPTTEVVVPQTVEPEPVVTEVAPPAPAVIVPAGDNETIVWNRLIAEGFSREQTAGIMGNLKQEHNFQTSGDGLAQWIGGRRANLYARANPTDIHVQLDFLMEELNSGYVYAKQRILQSDLVGATLVFQNEYERCGDCRQQQRINYAYEILGRH